MKEYIIIAGIDGVGKTSFKGILLGEKHLDEECLHETSDFSSIKDIIHNAHFKEYFIKMYYIGLNSVEESLSRIANRVRKGGHDIPKEYVTHRYNNRIQSLENVIPLCDKVIFYDNENGFVKVAEMTNHKFLYTNGLRPEWLCEIKDKLHL